MAQKGVFWFQPIIINNKKKKKLNCVRNYGVLFNENGDLAKICSKCLPNCDKYDEKFKLSHTA